MASIKNCKRCSNVHTGNDDMCAVCKIFLVNLKLKIAKYLQTTNNKISIDYLSEQIHISVADIMRCLPMMSNGLKNKVIIGVCGFCGEQIAVFTACECQKKTYAATKKIDSNSKKKKLKVGFHYKPRARTKRER